MDKYIGERIIFNKKYAMVVATTPITKIMKKSKIPYRVRMGDMPHITA